MSLNESFNKTDLNQDNILNINNNSIQQNIFLINLNPIKEDKNQYIIPFLQQETSLIWIVFGTIGNLLSLFVLLRRRMRIHSTFTYLTILALCDTLVLYFGLLRDYLVNKYKFDVHGDLICKFHVFSFYFVLHMASWLLVAVNIDRLIAASFLSLSKKWCTPRTALKVTLYIAIILVLLNCHFIYYVDSFNNGNNLNNKASNILLNKSYNDLINKSAHSKYSTLNQVKIINQSALISNNNNNNNSFVNLNFKFKKIFYISPNDRRPLDTFNNFVVSQLSDSVIDDIHIPTSKLTVQENINENHIREPINPYVYRKCLIKANHPFYSYFFQNIFTWIDASTQVILPFIIMVICNVNIIHKVLLTKNKTNGKNVKRVRKIKGMCIMIISVSIIFFILEAPVLIFICLMQGSYIRPDWPYIDLVWTIMNLMMYTNHVINFISYCMTGTKFRRELLRLLYVPSILELVSNFKNINLLSKKNNQNVNDKKELKPKSNIVVFDRLNNNFKTQLLNSNRNKEALIKINSVKEYKANHIELASLKDVDICNNIEKDKPVNLTLGILNKKNVLKENCVVKKKSSTIAQKLNEKDFVITNFNYENKSIFTNLFSNNNTNHTSNNAIEITDKQYSKDDSDILVSSVGRSTSFRSFKVRRRNKKKQREIAIFSQEKIELDEIDIEIDEESDNI